MKKKKTKRFILYIAGSLAAAAIIVGIAAFLMSYDETTNVFTAGNVKIVLTENKYPGNDSPEVKDIVPFTEIEKNPVITNTGSNNAYVFLRLTVPVSSFTELDEYGRKKTENQAAQEVFYLKNADDAISSCENNFGNGWREIRSLAEGGYYDDEGHWTFNKNADTRTYVFAYQLSPGDSYLEPGQSTVPLFGKVQYKNMLEQPGMDDPIKVIKVEAFAVQSDYLEAKEEEIIQKLDEEKVPENKREEQRLVEIFNMIG